jgi:hypothetical protein
LTDYNLNKISKVEARNALLACDLSIKLNDHYRNEINTIIEKPKRNKRIEIKPVDETIIEPVANEPVHEVVKKENE